MNENALIWFQISVLLFKICSAQDPTVMIRDTVPETEDNNIIVVERDTELIMNCYVENLYQAYLLRWQREYIDKDDGLFKTQSISQDMALDDNIHYSIEKPSQYTWSLRVRGVQVADEGRYICFVQMTQISRSKDYRDVKVIVKPFFEPQNISPDSSANEGESLNLICNATGIPTPNVIWSRLGGALLSIGQEKYEGSQLSLRNLQAGDRGTYRCTSMNGYGTNAHDVEVDIKFKPIVTVGKLVYEQAVGYRIELQCFIESNPLPKTELTAWIKGTTTFTQSSDRYTINWIEGAFNRMTYELIIKNVQPEDFGTFSCRVTIDEEKKSSTAGTITLKQVSMGTGIERIPWHRIPMGIESDKPQPSIKLGRVIGANENPEESFSHQVTALLNEFFKQMVLEIRSELLK
ncbi:hypothetical protein HELRODRAFT_194010 [Helobdella robusta]|uniref:Ig-like domain-containing protein n=1 Tax=Helobdella robusta TaxID=6412 RepID=T1FVK4_HELRO|nr:hypothetical protein HELRODRAFT_194010 [Helobdella robusta]ESN93654.1 hypothetical protein HELRODRAFT_194010 [Helobdella robusta]